MNQEIAERHSPELTVAIIGKYICPQATEAERYMFLQLCLSQNLNPFLRDAYLIKYGNSPATMVVGKDTYTKRAEAHPSYDGFEAGIIVMVGDKPVQRPGSNPGINQLVGGWAKVYRKDKRVPTYAEVDFNEYNTNKSGWAKMPATMIRKVALVQALRETFPQTFAGLYDASEMGVDLPEGDISKEKESVVDADVDAGSEAKSATVQEAPTTFGELWTWAMHDLGMNKNQALTALGFASQQDINITYQECWQKLLGATGKTIDNPM